MPFGLVSLVMSRVKADPIKQRNKNVVGNFVLCAAATVGAAARQTFHSGQQVRNLTPYSNVLLVAAQNGISPIATRC